MNREDILAAARENGNKTGEYEKQTLLRGDNIASVAGMLLGIILLLVELWIKKEVNMALASVIFTISSIQSIYEGIKLHKKLCIAVGIFVGVCGIFALVIFALMMVVA